MWDLKQHDDHCRTLPCLAMAKLLLPPEHKFRMSVPWEAQPVRTVRLTTDSLRELASAIAITHRSC